MMIRIGVDIEHASTACVSKGVDRRLVATLTDIDDALGWRSGCDHAGRCAARSDRNDLTNPTTTEQPATLTLGFAAPDAMFDVLIEGILETRLGHRALGTDALGYLHADSIAWKEDLGCEISAFPLAHPFRIHGPSKGLEEATAGLNVCESSVPVLRFTTSVAFRAGISYEMSRY
jgi:hypothetical protein